MTNSENIVAAAENIVAAVRAGSYQMVCNLENSDRLLTEFEATEVTADYILKNNKRPKLQASKMGGYIIKK